MILAQARARFPQLEVASRDGERRNAEAKALAAGTLGAAAVGHPPSEDSRPPLRRSYNR